MFPRMERISPLLDVKSSLPGREQKLNKKLRKDGPSVQRLWKEFENDNNWNKTKVADLAMELNLTYNQVYKWNFDQKKRLRQKSQRNA